VLQLNGSWLHVPATLRPSSGQLVQIKCPHTVWDPILYAHCGHLICTSWPEDGCSVAETCSQEPLSCSTWYCQLYSCCVWHENIYACKTFCYKADWALFRLENFNVIEWEMLRLDKNRLKS